VWGEPHPQDGCEDRDLRFEASEALRDLPPFPDGPHGHWPFLFVDAARRRRIVHGGDASISVNVPQSKSECENYGLQNAVIDDDKLVQLISSGFTL
jgi:hypothetical protein